MELFLNADPKAIELDHLHTLPGQPDTTLAWKILPEFNSNCSSNRILSYGQCQQSSPIINITTNDRRVILSSDNFQLAEGELADFDISTLSEEQPGTNSNCPRLSETLRFNGKYKT